MNVVRKKTRANPKFLTAHVRAGLELAMRLAYSDIECSEPGDFTDEERAQFHAAHAWLHVER